MTKNELAKLIIESVNHAKFMCEDPIESVENYLDVLEPKNKEQFAKWGAANQQSTIDKCWEE